MNITKNYPPKGALEALNPLLMDARYYLCRSDYRASPTLLPQIEQAIEEIDMQLAAAPLECIKQIVARLMLHFPGDPNQKHNSIGADYTLMLQGYPEDLLCAAYQNVLKHHKQNSLPKIADLLNFMEPEIGRRRAVRHKLEILQKQIQKEVSA